MPSSVSFVYKCLGIGNTVCASRFYYFRFDSDCSLSPALCFPAVVIFQLVLKQPVFNDKFGSCGVLVL